MRFLLLALIAVMPLSALAETKKPAAPKEEEFPGMPFLINVKWMDEKNRIQPDHAFCVGAGQKQGHGRNQNPEVSWTKGPEGTKSYAIVMHDPDVPTEFGNANKEGVEIDAGQPRQVFYHWLLANIPAAVNEIPLAGDSDGLKKDRPAKGKFGLRGVNDYTQFMKEDKSLAGKYVGYDGPCPPYNDARPHRYIFTLYALDVAKLDLPKDFTGPDLITAMQGHILKEIKTTGFYSRNPRLAP